MLARTLRFSLAALALGSFTLVACGGDSGGSAPAANPGTLNTQSAKSGAETAIAGATTAVKTKDGPSAASQLMSAGQQFQGSVTPSTGAAGAALPFPGRFGAVREALPTGCDCTDTKCTFTACQDSPNVTIDGSLAWDGGHVVCSALTYKITQGAAGVGTTTLVTDCDLTVTATSVDGTLHSTGSSEVMANGQSYAPSWDTSVAFKAVQLGASGPTGGSVDVTSTTSIAGQSYGASGSITFPLSSRHLPSRAGASACTFGRKTDPRAGPGQSQARTDTTREPARVLIGPGADPTYRLTGTIPVATRGARPAPRARSLASVKFSRFLPRQIGLVVSRAPL